MINLFLFFFFRSGTGLNNLRNKKDTYDFAQSETILNDNDYLNEPHFQMYNKNY